MEKGKEMLPPPLQKKYIWYVECIVTVLVLVYNETNSYDKQSKCMSLHI